MEGPPNTPPPTDGEEFWGVQRRVVGGYFLRGVTSEWQGGVRVLFGRRVSPQARAGPRRELWQPLPSQPGVQERHILIAGGAAAGTPPGPSRAQHSPQRQAVQGGGCGALPPAVSEHDGLRGGVPQPQSPHPHRDAAEPARGGGRGGCRGGAARPEQEEEEEGPRQSQPHHPEPSRKKRALRGFMGLEGGGA